MRFGLGEGRWAIPLVTEQVGSGDSVVGKDLETRGVSGEKASDMEQNVCTAPGQF